MLLVRVVFDLLWVGTDNILAFAAVIPPCRLAENKRSNLALNTNLVRPSGRGIPTERLKLSGLNRWSSICLHMEEISPLISSCLSTSKEAKADRPYCLQRNQSGNAEMSSRSNEDYLYCQAWAGCLEIPHPCKKCCQYPHFQHRWKEKLENDATCSTANAARQKDSQLAIARALIQGLLPATRCA